MLFESFKHWFGKHKTKILSVIVSLVFLFSSFFPYVVATQQVLASEEVVTETQVTDPTPIEPKVTEEVQIPTPTETENITNETPVEPSISDEVKTQENLDTPLKKEDSTPAENSNTKSNENAFVIQVPTTTPTLTEAQVTVSNEQDLENAEMTAVIIDSPSQQLLSELDSSNSLSSSASLTTDKPDYTAEELAVITGKGLNSNTDYTIIVSSNDEPAVSHVDKVTTDNDGIFTYAYQLDGRYRPNYLVELKDAEGKILATVTFLDNKNVTLTKTGTGTGTVTSTSSPTQATQINCGATCVVSFDNTAQVSLTAVASIGSSIGTWTVPAGYAINSGCTAANSSCVFTLDNVARTVSVSFVSSDVTAPTGGSISYTNGYFTTASVALTVEDGTDVGSGINTGSRIVQRQSATLSAGSCGAFGALGNITPTGVYPNFTDTTVVTGNCYKYVYKVSDNASNQVTYTSVNVAKVDTGVPTIPGTPSTTTPTNLTTQNWTWSAATDSVSGIQNYLYRISGSATVSLTTTGSNVASFVTNLGEGLYSLFVTARDNAGNTGPESSGGILRVDTTKPLITGSASPVANGAGWNNTNVVVTFTCADTGASQSGIATNTVAGATLSSNGASQSVTNSGSCIDSAGNTALSSTVNGINIDKNAPTDPTDVASTSHTVSVTSSDNTIDESWTAAGSVPGATDALSGVDGYSYSFTAGAADLPDTTKDAEETATGTTSSTLADGTWYFHLRTVDNAGNWTSTVHKGPYLISTATLPDMVATKSNNVGGSVALTTSFSWKVRVANNGTASAVFGKNDNILEDNLPTGPTYTLGSFVSSGGISSNISCSIVSAGPHKNLVCKSNDTNSSTMPSGSYFDIFVTVTPASIGTLTNPRSPGQCLADSSGGTNGKINEQSEANNACTDSVTVINDTQSPTVPGTPTTTTPTNDSTPSWSWSASTDNVAVDHYIFYWDSVSGGESNNSGNIATNSFTHSSALTEGTWYAKVKAYDTVGNSSTSLIGSALVDLTAPTDPIASPDAGSYGSDQLVSLTSSDALSGLDKIFYTTDGSTPDNTSTEYTSHITVDKDMTVKAVAYDLAGNVSSVSTFVYEIAPTILSEGLIPTGPNAAIIFWYTDEASTSRVVYDKVQHPVLGSAPNYGYAFSTVEQDASPKVTYHEVVITGLDNDTIYYYRVISHGSPDKVGDERNYRTNTAPVIPSSNTTGTPATGGISTVPTTDTGTVLGTFFLANNEEVLGTNDEESTKSAGLDGEVKGDSTKVDYLNMNFGNRSFLKSPFFYGLLGILLLIIFFILGKKKKKKKKGN